MCNGVIVSTSHVPFIEAKKCRSDIPLLKEVSNEEYVIITHIHSLVFYVAEAVDNHDLTEASWVICLHITHLQAHIKRIFAKNKQRNRNRNP